METEKITIDDLIEGTFNICDVSGVGQVKSMKPDLEKLYSVFLRQIKNELLESADSFESDDRFFEYVSLGSVEEIFDNYLNNKTL